LEGLLGVSEGGVIVTSGSGCEASDAVLNAVDASLAVDTFDVGLSTPRPADVALLLRTVDAFERTECMDATDDRGVDAPSLPSPPVTIAGGACLRTRDEDAAEVDLRLEATELRSAADRKEGAMDEADDEVGVSFESGLGSYAASFRRVVVVLEVVFRGPVESVLLVVDRTDTASDGRLEAPLALTERMVLPARVECMLPDSPSSALLACRKPDLEFGVAGFAGFTPGISSSSTGTSISVPVRQPLGVKT
jgi:hypothetical protein